MATALVLAIVCAMALGVLADDFYYRKVGGVTFIKIGSRVFSTCRARRIGPLGKAGNI